ncbi:unnamed protein product, partial [Acidithrix sp. C25]
VIAPSNYKGPLLEAIANIRFNIEPISRSSYNLHQITPDDKANKKNTPYLVL